MILGLFNESSEAVVPVQIRSATGNYISVQAVIDTGFSNHLTLPLTLIDLSQLPFFTRRLALLSDGTGVEFDTCKASILWMGREKVIYVESSDCHPLLGMGLIEGCRFQVDAIEGGEVAISPLSSQ